MSSNHLIFSQKRFSNLIKREIKLSSRTLLYVTLSIIGISLSGTFFSLFSSNPTQVLSQKNLMVSLAFLMIIWASISFNEISSTPGRQAYLSLPSSHLEKVLSKWLNISLVIPVLFVFAYIVISWTSTLIINLITGASIMHDPFSADALIKEMLILFSIQSVFYLGSVMWPKYSLFKTGIAMMSVIFALMGITALFARIIFHEYANGNHFVIQNGDFNMDFISGQDWIVQLLIAAGTLFFMVVTYLKLKEKQL
ncbi:MAG: hypothetical protein K1X68_04625 [Saprospiraceae bacterium]|nr:hypothetical protein [Saprospiraceae bacterium]HMW38958.1 hypothetical protein [Saprospiraceae bacterium]HMX87080.1 hypothetical protein [Saprospiraceae bacterium]HMZ38840.1 hypothetical protein [Saprospiraceae bacterium]HNA63139.1 hypothetical protein [Saprospiraceae bacterium]